MARDAIARLYDVDANSCSLSPSAEDKGRYQHGIISFRAKNGKSIDLDKIHESITATRLSGGTNMKVDYLEITARGDMIVRENKLVLKVSTTGQELILVQDSEATAALGRLRTAIEGGQKIASVTGRVHGWNGRFPDVLQALAKNSGQPLRLQVTDFEVSAK